MVHTPHIDLLQEPGADLREGRGDLLRGEAGHVAVGEPGAQLALRRGPLRAAEDRRHAGGQDGQRGGVRGAAPDRAGGQARHGQGGVGADQRVSRGGLPRRDGAPPAAEAGGRSQAPRCRALVGGGQRAGADRRRAVQTLDEAGDAVHGADGGPEVEVRRATWDQFDLEAAVWVKPAETTKTANPHISPSRLLDCRM